jgi:hypothetical protein
MRSRCSCSRRSRRCDGDARAAPRESRAGVEGASQHYYQRLVLARLEPRGVSRSRPMRSWRAPRRARSSARTEGALLQCGINFCLGSGIRAAPPRNRSHKTKNHSYGAMRFPPSFRNPR